MWQPPPGTGGGEGGMVRGGRKGVKVEKGGMEEQVLPNSSPGLALKV